MDAAQGLAALVFAATFVVLAIGRIGVRAIPRGIAALVGGVLTLTLLVPRGMDWRAWRFVDWQVMGILAGLMVLAGLCEAAGLFAGLRRRLIHLNPALALWFALMAVAAMSALLLNDAAVVVLVPFFIPMIVALGLPAVPSVVLMAVAANVGSLLTPFGNPQNAVLAQAGALTMLDFLRIQGPIVAAGAILLGAAAWTVARRLPRRTHAAVAPIEARGRPWAIASVAAFLALAAAGPAWLGLGGAACVAAGVAFLGLRPWLGPVVDRAAWRALDWNVLLLFVGLYLLTAGMDSWFPAERLPLAALTSPWSAGAATTVLSNTVGNVPAILSFLRLDEAWTTTHAMFLVTTSTLGGTLLLSGSAASLLAADAARKHGIEVRFLPFLKTAVPWVLPLLLVGAYRTWA